MNSHLLQDGVILLKLETLGSILPVLRGDIARCAGQSALLHLGAFQNHLDSVAFNFLCHSLNLLADYTNVLPITITLGHCILQSGVESYLVNVAQTGSADVQTNPAVLFYIVELLCEQVHVEASLRATLGV